MNAPQKEDVVAFLLAVPALLFASFLLYTVWSHWRTNPPKQTTDDLHKRIRQAERENKIAAEKFHQAVKQFEATAKPGPEPSKWRHPLDHKEWDIKNQAYEHARQFKDDASMELKKSSDFLENLRRDIPPPAIPQPIRHLWNELVAPILHLFLGFALIGFSARVAFRYLLLKGRIGIVKL